MSEHTVDVADYADQTGLFDPDTFDATVTIIGCGGIGATLIPSLVAMGVKKFTLFDPDTIERRNVATQLPYRPADLGRSKVDRCAEYIQEYSPTAAVEVHKRLFTVDDSVESAVLICAVDSMSARKEIWQAVTTNNTTVELMLDGRIGGEHMSLFAIDPLDGQWYEDDWLFSNEQASPLLCSARAIIYPAVALSAFICSHVAHWHASGEIPPNKIDLSLTNVPFYQKVSCRTT